MSEASSISRKLAWRALMIYEKIQRDPGDILRSIIPSEISKQDLGLAWELTNGAIRYKKKLDYIARSLIKASLEKQKPEILAALRLGLYQLTQTRSIPDFAAVNETVALIKNSLSEKEAGFVNAILRNSTRKKIAFPDPAKDPVSYLTNYHSYPEWLVKRWLDRFGFEETEAILVSGNIRPRINLKVISSKIDLNEVFELLENDGIEAEKSKYFPDFIKCRDTSAVLKSKAFKTGLLNVQDESQGLPVYLLDPPEGATALDLCSAPGGKSIALADKVGNSGRVISLDNSRDRLNELKENIERTGFENIEIIQNDIFKFATNEKFGYILLDVPCSGLGTLAANADLRWTKSQSDIDNLSELQGRMLKKASEMLTSGGVLVYSTCTTEPEEIEEVVYGFLETNPDFTLEDGNSSMIEPFKSEIGIYRSWPHKHGIGGGGFARLKKL
ncbi:MAG: 16S rRNA (cytosine(967)-C(5))-methyltransferase RsmB [candidate division Zixibacteria bacterium]